MLSPTRSEFVGCKLQGSIEVVDLDVFDQAKKVEVEEQRCIRIEKLYSQHCYMSYSQE